MCSWRCRILLMMFCAKLHLGDFIPRALVSYKYSYCSKPPLEVIVLQIYAQSMCYKFLFDSSLWGWRKLGRDLLNSVFNTLYLNASLVYKGYWVFLFKYDRCDLPVFCLICLMFLLFFTQHFVEPSLVACYCKYHEINSHCQFLTYMCWYNSSDQVMMQSSYN